MLLFELFDDIYPFQINRLGGADLPPADARWLTTDGRPFVVHIRPIRTAAGTVEFEFADESSGGADYDATGRGDAFKIMGTAFAVLADYARHYQPDEIIFDVNPFEAVRKPIYAKLSKKFLGPLGYAVDVHHSTGDEGTEEITFRLSSSK